MPVFQAVLEVTNQPDLRNTNWKNLPTSRVTSFSNHDVAKTGQSQPADDVVESKLTMPVLQLEVINQPDLKNSKWKNLPTSRATSFSNHDVAKTGQNQPADDVVESKLTMPVLQAVLEVTNQSDLRNTNWKNLPTSRATSFSKHEVTKSRQSQPADDVVESNSANTECEFCGNPTWNEGANRSPSPEQTQARSTLKSLEPCFPKRHQPSEQIQSASSVKSNLERRREAPPSLEQTLARSTLKSLDPCFAKRVIH